MSVQNADSIGIATDITDNSALEDSDRDSTPPDGERVLDNNATSTYYTIPLVYSKIL